MNNLNANEFKYSVYATAISLFLHNTNKFNLNISRHSTSAGAVKFTKIVINYRAKQWQNIVQG